MTFAHILPRAFFIFCENTWPGSYLVKSQWGFAIVETFHIMALGMLLGTLAIVDIRLLGFGMRRQTPAQLYNDLAPWTWLGVVLMVCTGVPPVHVGGPKALCKRPLFLQDGFFDLGPRHPFHAAPKGHDVRCNRRLRPGKVGGVPFPALLAGRRARRTRDRIHLERCGSCAVS